ncbi:MAG: ABC-type transporter, permease component: FeT family, partial [Pseudomonadota bacterium]
MNPRAPTVSIAPRLLTLSTAVLVIAILLPIAAVAVFGVRALGSPGTLMSLAESVLLGYVLNTLGLSLLAALVALVLGLPSAWFISAYRFSGSRVLQWSLVVPMAMPA